MATVNPTPIQPKATTAEDTLQRKSRDASVISGGHLVAKAGGDDGDFYFVSHFLVEDGAEDDVGVFVGGGLDETARGVDF